MGVIITMLVFFWVAGTILHSVCPAWVTLCSGVGSGHITGGGSELWDTRLPGGCTFPWVSDLNTERRTKQGVSRCLQFLLAPRPGSPLCAFIPFLPALFFPALWKTVPRVPAEATLESRWAHPWCVPVRRPTGLPTQPLSPSRPQVPPHSLGGLQESPVAPLAHFSVWTRTGFPGSDAGRGSCDDTGAGRNTSAWPGLSGAGLGDGCPHDWALSEWPGPWPQMALQTTGEWPGASLRGFSSWDQSSAHLSSCGPGLTLPVPAAVYPLPPRPSPPASYPFPTEAKRSSEGKGWPGPRKLRVKALRRPGLWTWVTWWVQGCLLDFGV